MPVPKLGMKERELLTALCDPDTLRAAGLRLPQRIATAAQDYRETRLELTGRGRFTGIQNMIETDAGSGQVLAEVTPEVALMLDQVYGAGWHRDKRKLTEVLNGPLRPYRTHLRV